MDSFEWNKVAGAVLASALFIMVLKLGSEAVFHVPPPAQKGYAVEGVEEAAAGTSGPAANAPEEIPDWGTVLPAADLMAGEVIAKRCAQCHTWDMGGANKIGPNQFDIVGRARAMKPGFTYSAAMKNKGGEWTYDELFQYIRSPARYIPGNKMAFAGVPRAQDRINLIAYMRTWTDNPHAIPPPKPAAPAAAPADGAPAEGSAAAPAPAAPGKAEAAPAAPAATTATPK